MERKQLQEIKEMYDMLNKGLTNPLKTNTVYQYLQPMQGIEVPIRVKINAINRFMMLNYRDEYDAMVNREKQIDMPSQPILTNNESIGSVENKDKQSHTEDINDVKNFLTKSEKESLKDNQSGTQLNIHKKRGRIPNANRKEK